MIRTKASLKNLYIANESLNTLVFRTKKCFGEIKLVESWAVIMDKFPSTTSVVYLHETAKNPLVLLTRYSVTVIQTMTVL